MGEKGQASLKGGWQRGAAAPTPGGAPETGATITGLMYHNSLVRFHHFYGFIINTNDKNVFISLRIPPELRA